MCKPAADKLGQWHGRPVSRRSGLGSEVLARVEADSSLWQMEQAGAGMIDRGTELRERQSTAQLRGGSSGSSGQCTRRRL